MFAGHLGAALILKDPKRPIGLGTLFFCAMFMDVVLWVLVLVGMESAHIPLRLESMADVTFTFPYSHGLVAALAWSIMVGAVMLIRFRDYPAGVLTVAAVFSHFALDWLVHVPELPLAGNDSIKLGLGLWRNLPFAWTIEVLIVGAGLWIFLKRTRLSTTRKVTLFVVMVLLTVMTIFGQASKSPPPSIQAMAISSLVAIAVITGFGWWIDSAPALKAKAYQS